MKWVKRFTPIAVPVMKWVKRFAPIAVPVMRWVKRFASIAVRFLEYSNYLLTIMTVLVAATLMVIVTYQVVVRYFFHGSTAWVFEIAKYGMVFVIFAPLARAEQIGQHIRVDGIIARLSLKTNTRLNVVTLTLSLIFVSIFLWSSTRYALLALDKGWNTHPYGLGWDQWPILAVIPISFCLLWLNLLVSLIRNIAGLFRKEQENT